MNFDKSRNTIFMASLRSIICYRIDLNIISTMFTKQVATYIGSMPPNSYNIVNIESNEYELLTNITEILEEAYEYNYTINIDKKYGYSDISNIVHTLYTNGKTEYVINPYINPYINRQQITIYSDFELTESDITKIETIILLS